MTEKKGSIYFVSLGCPRNLVDTEVMLGIVMAEGYDIATTIDGADYIVVNTCGFLEEARQEAISTIQEMCDEKKATAKVVVTGCMVQNHGDTIREECPDVHYLVGSGDTATILEALEDKNVGETVSSAKSFIQQGDTPRTISTPPHYAYLKIAEGCRKRCSFCIIPDIKGPLKSKTTQQVVKEFKGFVEDGVKEIILIAQDLGDFGKDTGETLAGLLKELCAVPGDYWIRLLYLYPDEITDEVIDIIKEDDRICPYLDMPIQHINNTILSTMRRATTKEDIIDIITKLRKTLPDIVIRTSLMVGFPGENDEQFQELLDFVKKYKLDNIGVFIYSPEKGSTAETLPGQVHDDVKEKRYNVLMAAQQKISYGKNRAMIGKKIRVIVDGYHPETELLLSARTQGQCPDIDGTVIVNDYTLVDTIGEFYTAEITDAADYDLIAKIIDN
ncbi:MAG: 30S ribosomal protein S12 methylthiotransferase RimO [Waddliaceae bacterium]|jgi:ribosomal protein S12 methylthiotransferase|nr:30S ribosomal protein S12 methylthiotransferase RimO [Waddliaceae bacterium]MBT3579570.1 30S ribosomal protein S12 methylthiotransferase RimO [Waddliaceae bacterium]MBT4444432.1 30S ribosomal protein S12 methylthiotransferase RimO [Waddliaceae bacterium]MBT6928177.1 30S ribosomal protein S12 methylthiotransferase RimO [Waddliaceae bacterium]MBT7263953.1 30S ribosomal protein S12 methylthiotransferase RimO [Waddliaceae bacterium]